MENPLHQTGRDNKTETFSGAGDVNRVDLNLLAVSKAEVEPDKLTCSERTDTKELSKVGPYVSTEIDTNSNCKESTHPTDSHEFKTVDTNVGNRRLQLTDLFKKEDVYAALMNDKIIQSALSSVNAHPKNFEELQKLLSGNEGQGISLLQNRPNKEPLDVNLNKNVLSNFAFHHLEGNKIAIRLLPDYGSEAARNQMTQLGIALPIPSRMKDAFVGADKGKNGFLMKDSKQRGKASSNHRDYEVQI